jgi:hypothetical protein
MRVSFLVPQRMASGTKRSEVLRAVVASCPMHPAQPDMVDMSLREREASSATSAALPVALPDFAPPFLPRFALEHFASVSMNTLHHQSFSMVTGGKYAISSSFRVALGGIRTAT